MLLEEVAVKCMVNSNLAKTKEEALTRLKEEFLKSYPTVSYEAGIERWIKPLQKTSSQTWANGSMSVRSLIKNLETIARLL